MSRRNSASALGGIDSPCRRAQITDTLGRLLSRDRRQNLGAARAIEFEARHRPRRQSRTNRAAGSRHPAPPRGLDIVVSHFPPGTSKWNKIEHRLFSFISQNWHADFHGEWSYTISPAQNRAFIL